MPEPRWETALPPEAVGSDGPKAIDWARRVLGFELTAWQRHGLTRALATDRDGRYVFRHYLLSTGRQNGKTLLTRALIGWAIEEHPVWRRIWGLAFDRRQASVLYREVAGDLAERPGIKVTAYHGITTPGGHRYDTASRGAKDNLRGSTTDLAVFDEVMTHRDDLTWSALLPTIATRPQALILATSSAGDDRSVLLRDWWDRGLSAIREGRSPEGFGMSWWAAGDDDAPDDPAAWLKANPSLSAGILTTETIAYERSMFAPASFRRERLNLWSDSADDWLPPGLWRSLAAPERRIPLDSPRIVIAADVTPSWQRCTVAVAARLAEGLPHVAITDEIDALRQRGDVRPGQAVDAVRRAVATWAPAAVLYDAHGTIAPHLERAGIADAELVPVSSVSLLSVCAHFEGLTRGRELTHAGDDVLAVSLASAARSEIGDGWRWTRKRSTGHIDAIVAASIALWGATSDEVIIGPQVF
jgi:phage terminase large subunit-like protein